MSQHPTNPVFSDTPTFYQKDTYTTEYRTDLIEVTDWLGNPVHVGDSVMYCIGAGRGQMMAIGEVKAMRAGMSSNSYYDRDVKRWIKTRSGYTDIEIQVLTEKTSGSWDNKKRTRAAWINPMNVTALKGLEA